MEGFEVRHVAEEVADYTAPDSQLKGLIFWLKYDRGF
jgi:hypothetical protein